MSPLFLTLDEILALHEEQIAEFGGINGIRHIASLESAIGNVEATLAGAYLHETLHEMAAAYLFSICRNHPFLDGNKRTAAAAALTFLDMNDVELNASEDELYELVMGVAEGRITKAQAAVFFQEQAV